MSDCTPEILLAHADHLEHVAAVGGYLLHGGQRVTLDQPTRQRWARDAALFREIALERQQRDPLPEEPRHE